MQPASDEKNKTAAALYVQLQKELAEVAGIVDDDEGYRLQELEKIARIYALVAHSPDH